MWVDSKDIVQLLGKLDEAQAAISGGTVDPSLMEQWISEVRQILYADIEAIDKALRDCEMD